jgi:hypothetical protein
MKQDYGYFKTSLEDLVTSEHFKTYIKNQQKRR